MAPLNRQHPDYYPHIMEANGRLESSNPRHTLLFPVCRAWSLLDCIFGWCLDLKRGLDCATRVFRCIHGILEVIQSMSAAGSNKNGNCSVIFTRTTKLVSKHASRLILESIILSCNFREIFLRCCPLLIRTISLKSLHSQLLLPTDGSEDSFNVEWLLWCLHTPHLQFRQVFLQMRDWADVGICPNTSCTFLTCSAFKETAQQSFNNTLTALFLS